MIRDNKRRKLIEKYATERLRLVAMKRNNILPPELRVYILYNLYNLKNI